MTLVLSKLYGVDPDLEAGLKKVGIRDTDDLLARCATPVAMAALAEQIGMHRELLQRLVNRAQFAQIRGIGAAYTVLLEAVGIQTIHDLAVRGPEDLRSDLNRVNSELKLVGRVPALAMVNGWVNKAQRNAQANK
jgi:predicted flap endonuclease-1-like 5' DNA nuclease